MKTSLPARVQAIGVQVLCDTFARVFDVQAPDVRTVITDSNGNRIERSDLYAFRAFSMACIDAALESPAYARERRAALRDEALRLGGLVRKVLNPRDEELPELVAYLYRAIGITVRGPIPGTLIFTACYFGEGYTPEHCAFMSAFDDGFVSGLCGGGSLVFSERITQGCPCCKALFASEGGLQQ